MLRVLTLFLALVMSAQSYAATASSAPKASSSVTAMTLLDNRFRVDPTITQITFVIYRSDRSKPVVLVRPDGVKYYAWRAPKNVRWYKERTMDIISIDHPMPGPWQAIGKVTPKNHIKLVSNLALTADKLPLRLYEGEVFKFSARLTSNGKPLTLRDFIERVNLHVTLQKYVKSEEDGSLEPAPIELGKFSDNGQDLDEHPGDGVFTVKLHISAPPGKYHMHITSGNGIFLRAQEQEVLVYPTPYTATFIQSRLKNKPHYIKITTDPTYIKPGSLVAHIEHENEYGERFSKDAQSGSEGNSISISIPYNGTIGQFKWFGRVYATDATSNRGLYFDIAEHTYTVTEDIDYEKTRKMQEAAHAAQQRAAEKKAREEFEAAQRKTRTLYIIFGNLMVLVFGVLIWFVWRKLKARRELRAQMKLAESGNDKLTMPKE